MMTMEIRLSRLHTHRRPELDDMLFDDDEIRLKFQRNDKEVLDILKAFESKVEESRFSQQDETVSPQKSTTPSCSTPSFPPQPVHLQAADGVVAQPQLNEKSTQPVLTLEQASSQSDARSELSLTSLLYSLF
uniref:Uncharacterized protein n=1 Tax=Spongospora subterranea TaxID=70186 RepID=A0A0H5RCF2_9EUKA|eukprot:CRZ11920.1 hypothetical protein [Spongospora subterranea]